MAGALEISQQNQHQKPWSTPAEGIYTTWRTAKLETLRDLRGAGFVTIRDLAKPAPAERRELVQRCHDGNLALYQCDSGGADTPQLREGLLSFASAMGLRMAESHRSADSDGLVALNVRNAPAQAGYIPYSRRPMNWHTDGYYNAPDKQIRAMILHCAIPAEDGGENQFLDPELAYLRLRDLDPNFITALMHPQAMSIPENREPDGTLRPVSIGPVFSVDENGELAMRYTARTRSIHWRDDTLTRAAVKALQTLLEAGDPLMQTVRFKVGQGVLCNNVLHNRTGFDPDDAKTSNRLVFRARFHNRIEGS